MTQYVEAVTLMPVITLRELKKLIPECPIDEDELILNISFGEGVEEGSYLNLDAETLEKRTTYAYCTESEATACMWLAKAIQKTGVPYGESILVWA